MVEMDSVGTFCSLERAGVSFKPNPIKNLLQEVIANEKIPESRRYFYMTHPKDHLKESRFLKDLDFYTSFSSKYMIFFGEGRVCLLGC
ncbi:hypothetical protein QR680_004554 [Steinernema hermaphroditum]|uniref:Uncharacterized protein n=1 Tax=Steinernema hermaphroditum TaxID=289476 RepID=A0AA39HP30_9BILA|nr:hypothetical protein QR680_004554 [Steinernema hermaphroditum]